MNGDGTRSAQNVLAVDRGAQLYDVIDRWLRDPSFRAALRHDPETTVRKMGIELSSGEWAGLRDLVCG